MKPLPMFRDRLRATVRLKGSSNQQSNFRQSVLLVLIGALISFVSSLTTNFFSSKNENQKIELEQKVLYEKEVASCIAENILDVEQIATYAVRPNLLREGDSGWIKHTIDSFWKANSITRQQFILKEASIKILMYSYADTSLCNQFESLSNNLDDEYYWIDVRMHFLYNFPGSIEYQDAFYQRQGTAVQNLDGYKSISLRFMRDFHAAILK